MRTLTWAAIMFISPFTMKGLIVFAPVVAVIAYLRWSVLIALVIVGSMVGLAAADEREAMDFDTCMEHQGDVSEHFYSDGWKVVRSDDNGKTSHWIKEKGDKQVHLICEGGLSIIETRTVDVKPHGQVEYQK